MLNKLRTMCRNAWSVALVSVVVAILVMWCIPAPAFQANLSPAEIIHQANALEARYPLAKVVLVASETVALLSIYVGVKTLRLLYIRSTFR